MAERRDQPLRPGDATLLEASPLGSPHPESTPRPPIASYPPGDREPERIQEDIRHTRAEMSETLDELGHRLSPQYIKEQVKDSVRSTAHDAGTSMLDTIKENPIPALIAGLSVGWLIAKAGQSDRRERDEYGRYYRAGYGPEYGYGPYYAGREPYPYGGRYDDEGRSVADRVGAVTHEARERAADAAHEARERVGDVADSARELAYEAGHRAQDVAYEARRYGRRATNWLERTMEENPLAAGAVALAAGALVGLAVPETEPEHRLMGEASDRVKEQAQSLAEEKLEKAKAVASEVAEEAREGAQDVADTARDRAQDVARTAEQESRRQGLTSGS